MENSDRYFAFTRVGSQVQSLHRPPFSKAFFRAFLDPLCISVQGYAALCAQFWHRTGTACSLPVPPKEI